MEIRHFTIERDLRYAVLEPGDDPPAEVWFVLHGYGQLAPRFLHAFRELDDGTRRIVAPEGLHRYYVDHDARKVGASWMTCEDRLTDIEDYVRYLDRLHRDVLPDGDGVEARVVAVGFSQGVHTLCRWLAYGEARIDLAALWGAAVPPDLDLEADGEGLRRTDLRLVAGEEDPLFPPETVAAVQARLGRHGIPFELLRHPGGHRIDGSALARIADAGRSRRARDATRRGSSTDF